MPFSFLSLCFSWFDLSSPRISIKINLMQLKGPREARRRRDGDSDLDVRPGTAIKSKPSFPAHLLGQGRYPFAQVARWLGVLRVGEAQSQKLLHGKTYNRDESGILAMLDEFEAKRHLHLSQWRMGGRHGERLSRGYPCCLGNRRAIQLPSHSPEPPFLQQPQTTDNLVAFHRL